LRARFERDGYYFSPEFSGRAACFRLALHLRAGGTAPLALVPDYICNVVHHALEKAGFEVRSYNTDELFEPDCKELEEQLQSRPVGILLTASVFGSSAALDAIGSGPLHDVIVNRHVHVIADLCQDISLVNQLPSTLGPQLSAIVSFNDKSFLGMMGGGVIATQELTPPHRRLSCRLRLKLYELLWRKVRSASQASQAAAARVRLCDVAGSAARPSYDYSYCRDFPYTCVPYKATRLQLIMALIGLEDLPQILRRRRDFATDHAVDLLQTKYYLNSPYVVARQIDLSLAVLRRRKGSYALHGHPDISLRPDLSIWHNKGFLD